MFHAEDQAVYASNTTKKFEHFVHMQHSRIQFLAIKSPFIKNDKLLGVIGISHNLGEESYDKIQPSISLPQEDIIVDYKHASLLSLSSQELMVLKFAALRKTAKETAHILNLSFGTVESYFENIKRKLFCKSKREAIDIYLSTRSDSMLS